MKSAIAKSFVMLALLFLALSTSYAGGSDPIAMLQSLADQMIAGLKSNKASLKTNPSVVYSLANKIVVPHADISYMSQRVIPPKVWNAATASQRSKFQTEFTKLLVRTYASALSDYTNQTVKFFPIRGNYQGKSSVTVASQIIRADGPSVSVVYRLIGGASGYKLYDMSVEGVSLIESFRSQFSSRLSTGNMDGLIQDLVRHNASKAS
jgi:phospholipid transport system substrate-binding protein